MSIPTSLLQPVSSISTYGKILSSGSKGGHQKKETRELLLDMNDEEDNKKAKDSKELSGPPKHRPASALPSSITVKNPNKQSACFMVKGKVCDRSSANQGIEPTPEPTHYNPNIRLTRPQGPKYSIPRPATAMSRRPDKDDEGSDYEGWNSRLHTALCSGRPNSALTATPSRTDRLSSVSSPWLKNMYTGTTSSFRTIPRKPLYDGDMSELRDVPNIDVVRPRSACPVNLEKNIDRAQRNKTTRQGAPFGTYTLQLTYNRDGDNDLPVKRGVRKQDNGQWGPAANAIKMEQQRKRLPMGAPEGQFDKTPGLEKLGLTQSTWGTNDGWAGGTEELLTTKRSSYTKMNHIDWAQKKKAGYGSYKDPSMDIFYAVNDGLVHPRSKCSVDLVKSRKRETFGAETTEGPDVCYDWAKVVDRKHVTTPDIALFPDRETRKKQGFGSGQESLQDLFYDHERMNKALAHRVKTPDVEKTTSRDPPALLPKENYEDQLAFGKSMRTIGELSRSPVFGASPLVPDMGGKSKRFPERKSKKKEGMHL